MTRAIATGAQGPQGPGLRVRLLLPASELGRHGVEILPLPLFSAAGVETLHTGRISAQAAAVIAARIRFRRDLRAIEDADVAVVQRQVDPLPGRQLERAVMAGRRLVLDVDDAVWLSEPGSHPLTKLRRNAEKLKWLAARADRVIAGNAYLAEWLARFAREVTVVPSLVDTDRTAKRVHVASNALVLGWIGSPSTAPYLAGLREALVAFARRRADLSIRLIVIGGPAPALAGVSVEQRSWSEGHEATALAEMDVGLMPLPDNAWTRGKCAYKALQYMSAGVPVVADDVGMTSRVVGDGAAGLVARSPNDWNEALACLADSAPLRQRMGDAGRRRVERDFSVRRWAPTLADAIAGAR